MPWTVGDVDSKHKGLSPDQKAQWVAVANDVLAKTGDEGRANPSRQRRGQHRPADQGRHVTAAPYAVSYHDAQAALRAARRERQVAFLQQVLRSGSQKEAAEALGVSVQHVKNTLRDLYDRIGASSMAEATYILWLRDLWHEDT